MSLSSIHEQIISCTRCPRLRAYCERIAREKKAAHRHEIYWAKPVPGFGDSGARLFVLGLAPAAHGANRTGRVFTGDGSGDFLMRAMHRHGFATIPSSRDVGDDLRLRDAYIAAALRCAPPNNKPTPAELIACLPHLQAELDALPHVTVIVALGRIAFETCWQVLDRRGVRVRPKPRFAHGHVYSPAGGPIVMAAFHPSRQNTNTGRLTPKMLSDVFGRARRLIEEG